MAKSQLTRNIENMILYQRKQGVLLCPETAVNFTMDGSRTKNVDVMRYNRFNDEFTCYEIKISKADFNSKNGHNFVGNKNYYVVPADLKDYVKERIKDTDIGLIVYPSNGMAKHAGYREIDNDTRFMFMFNMAKGLERERRKIWWKWKYAEEENSA
jgi:hypothetical protein